MHPTRIIFSSILLLASALVASAAAVDSHNAEIRATPTDPNRIVLELSSTLAALKPKGSASYEILSVVRNQLTLPHSNNHTDRDASNLPGSSY